MGGGPDYEGLCTLVRVQSVVGEAENCGTGERGWLQGRVSGRMRVVGTVWHGGASWVSRGVYRGVEGPQEGVGRLGGMGTLTVTVPMVGCGVYTYSSPR